MITDLVINDNENVRFSFVKPFDFEEYCNEFNISYPSLSIPLDFEYYLSRQINTLIKNSVPIDSMYFALLELRIPTGVPVRISLTKVPNNDWHWCFDLCLIKNNVTIRTEERSKSNTICD